MGGFRINGCGVADHFKKIKSLGMHVCPVCGKDAEFFLEEAKQKIDVIFIPTVTLKSRYAVMCKKCGQGRFCSEQWAIQLINSSAPPAVIFESDVQQTPPPVPESIPPAPEIRSEIAVTSPQTPKPTRGVSSSLSFFRCPQCGVTQIREGNFCSYCNYRIDPIPEDPNSYSQSEQKRTLPPVSSALDICPSCGSHLKKESKFCTNCGQPLGQVCSVRRVCPGCGAKVLDGMSFCMECGRKL